jgi:hypothetical protein
MRTLARSGPSKISTAATVLTDGAEALGRAELLAEEYPDGWVYIHVDYRGDKG